MDKNIPECTESENKEGLTSEKRRTLTKAALTSPVIMTLASRPVWGNQCSISGMQSGAHSGEDIIVCHGCTPGYWGQHPNEWTYPYEPGSCIPGTKMVGQGFCQKSGEKLGSYDYDGTIFNDIFNGGTTYSLDGKELTMMQVINLSGVDDKFQLGAHAVAALLNAAKSEVNYGYTPAEILTIWNTWTGTAEELKVLFATLNEDRSCPL